MAGAGRKVFAVSEVLTAANVNDYLMDQSVMVFADSAARSSAIGTPTAGMVSYLVDTSALEVYGTAWAGVSNPGDITGVTAGTALTGGGVSGDVTLDVDLSAIVINNTQVTSTLTSSTATTYTIATADAGTYLQFTNAATLTVSTATDFSTGEQVQVLADGTALSITTDGATIAGAGTSTTSGTFTIGNQYEAVAIISVGSDAYRIIGNITAV